MDRFAACLRPEGRGDAIATLVIIALTCVVSWQAWRSPALLEELIFWPPALARGQYHRLLGHGLIHADGQHLLFNMVTLYFFGSMIERMFVPLVGESGYVLFYASAIVVAILPTWVQQRNNADYRSLGASGAVSAVLFAFILLQPTALIFVFFIPMPAVVYAVIYVGYSVYMGRRKGDNINHAAHLTGAAWGIACTILIHPQAPAGFIAQLRSLF